MAKKKNKENFNSKPVERSNGLTEFALGLRTQQNQIAQPDTAEVNLRRFMITNNRMLLSQMYVEIGIVQTLIDQPVDDAYSKLPTFKCEQLNEDEIEEVRQYIVQHKWFEIFKQALKWSRLYGGAGLFINTSQNPESEFRIDKLNQNSNIEIYALDRWELNYKASGVLTVENFQDALPVSDDPYNIYGQTVNKSRVLQIKGKEAPSILRLQLMGWGMSEVERLLRSLNSYLKNQDVIFELLDEAKLDVYKVDGFNQALRDDANTITKQITLSNSIKSYLNALVMDKEDEYDQKTLSFAGLPDMNIQNKQNIASDLKMPVTKLFGVSSSGFNSGEDDIENYNSMLEGEIRAKNNDYLMTIFKLACLKVHDFLPEDVDMELPSLRILSSEQEENVKNQKFNRLIQAYQAQVITEREFKEACNKDNLLPIDVSLEDAPKLDEMPEIEEKKNSKKWYEIFKTN